MSVFDRLVSLGQPRGAQWTLRPSGRFEPRHPEYIWEGPATPMAARPPYAAAVDDTGDAGDARNANEPSEHTGRDRSATRLRPVETPPETDDREMGRAARPPAAPRAAAPGGLHPDEFADAVAAPAARAASGSPAPGPEAAPDAGAEREGTAPAVSRERIAEEVGGVPAWRTVGDDPFAIAAAADRTLGDAGMATPETTGRSADAGRRHEIAPIDSAPISRPIDPDRIGEAVLAALRERGLVGGAARAEQAEGRALPAEEPMRTVVGLGRTETSGGGGEIRVSIDRVSIVPPAAPARADRAAPPGRAAPSRLAAFLDERGRAAR